MMVSFPVYKLLNHRVNRESWWENFTKTTRNERFGSELNFNPGAWIKHRDQTLIKYGAKYDGECVHFDDAESATLFFLKCT